MITDPIEDAIKGEHVIVADPGIIPFDRCEEVKIRTIAQLLNDPDGREPFVRDNDAAPDIIIQDKRTIGDRIDAVAGKYLRADRFHGFDVVGIDNGNVPAALDSGFVRESRKILDGTGVLFEHPVDCHMVISCDPHGSFLVNNRRFPPSCPRRCKKTEMVLADIPMPG